MNGKNGITITLNHSETSIKRMKHQLVATPGKLGGRLDKYQH